ncbi:MAG: phosphoribosylglycinamide formyltransferase [Brumimicrobium sp.]|nr:phosphoribosylglycinamide formyltransferase [Brumimicrobium sp.]
MKKRIAIFASGSGSNALKMIDHFKENAYSEIALLVTNNPNAGILEKSKDLVPQEIITNDQANDGEFLTDLMHLNGIDYIVLAGYLRKIPVDLIHFYPEQIINIHPALLPNYGGKGMYGMNVHKAVYENQEKESGITIHLVNELYDKGKTLYQHKVEIAPEDTPEMIQQKVLKVEHLYFSKVVDEYIQSQHKK